MIVSLSKLEELYLKLDDQLSLFDEFRDIMGTLGKKNISVTIEPSSVRLYDLGKYKELKSRHLFEGSIGHIFRSLAV